MVAATVLFFALAAAPQTKPPATSASQSRRSTASDTDDSPNSPMTPAKILKMQHEETLKDIDKLVKLVAEVQDEIEKGGENVLPLSTLKKLEEVERLSRKIRGKIKQ